MSGEYIYTKPAEIEAASMRIIDDEMKTLGIECADDDLDIVKRVIHTTADFDYGKNLMFTKGASNTARHRLQAGGATIITDTNMALSGVNKTGLERLDADAVCYMAREDIRKLAKDKGTTRAYASMKKGAEDHPDGIFAVGNAPTALIALEEKIHQGYMPELVIAAPVGFVNVVAAKERIMAAGVPYICNRGRKGGSNVAAAICNAILYNL